MASRLDRSAGSRVVGSGIGIVALLAGALALAPAAGADSSPFERMGAVILDPGEDFLESGVIDPGGEFAYFGTATFPGRVVKIAIGAGRHRPARHLCRRARREDQRRPHRRSRPGRRGRHRHMAGGVDCDRLRRRDRRVSQGGTPAWATTTTDDDTITVRHANKNNQVLNWTIGDLDAADTATTTLEVDGTTGRKAACDTLAELTGSWSATATVDATPTKYDHAPPVTVSIGGDGC